VKPLLAIIAVVALGAPMALARSTVACSSPGDWPHTKDAAWLARALTRAGLGSFGCTGSAFIVDLGGPTSTGQIYVWTTHGSRVNTAALARSHRASRIRGVVVRYDHLRGLWPAKGRNVWVMTASHRLLLPLQRWSRIVRATLVTPG
jgi:hypothetical protein